jgi:hypothetical protein
MKKLLLALLAAFCLATPLAAQVTITSFNQGGQLTWTNFFTNATYRVEWAGSPTRPWQPFDVLTNLTLLSATSNSVTVSVPTFYRVVWLNPPQPQPTGTWDYQAWDMLGTLVITGQLSLVLQTNQVDLTGTRDLGWTYNASSSDWYTQTGTGQVWGTLTGSELYVSLNPFNSDDNTYLHGYMFGGYASGSWDYDDFVGDQVEGRYVAIRRP